jgi:hypothetical protein
MASVFNWLWPIPYVSHLVTSLGHELTKVYACATSCAGPGTPPAAVICIGNQQLSLEPGTAVRVEQHVENVQQGRVALKVQRVVQVRVLMHACNTYVLCVCYELTIC